MPSIATRFLWITILIVAASAIAVSAARRETRRNDTCANPAGLALVSFPDAHDAQPTEQSERAHMIQHERAVVRRGARNFQVQIMRSWEPRVLHERPSRWVKGLENAESHDLESSAPGVPVYFTSNHTAAMGRVAAYTFLYGNQNTSSPFGIQIRNGWEELVRGKQPLTMIVVDGFIRPRQEEAWRTEARAWLGEAVTHYRAVCGE